MLRRLFLAIVLLFSASPATAIDVTTSDVVRIYLQGLGGGAKLSGVMFSKTNRYAYILTCAHGYPENHNLKLVKHVYVWTASGGIFEGKIAAVDFEKDLSILAIAIPPGQVKQIASRLPARGTELAWAGWDQFRGNWVPRKGVFSSVEQDGRIHISRAGSIQGQSGGPVLDPQGRVVGIVEATDGRNTIAVGLGTIQGFLRQNGF